MDIHGPTHGATRQPRQTAGVEREVPQNRSTKAKPREAAGESPLVHGQGNAARTAGRQPLWKAERELPWTSHLHCWGHAREKPGQACKQKPAHERSSSMSARARRVETTMCPSMDDGQCVPPHTEHHSATKRREALTLAATWTDLETTMLSERSQTQKDTQGVIPLMGNVQNRQIHRDREWVPGWQGLG